MKYARQDLEPLFEDVFWSRPERAGQASKLVFVGGNRDSIKAPLGAYSAAVDAGASTITICLPDVLKKDLSGMPGVVFCPNTSAGSLGKEALPVILDELTGSTILALIGDSGRSSESSQMLEDLCNKTGSELLVASESLDLLLERPGLHTRKFTSLVMNPGQFQRLVTNIGHTQAYKHDMPLAPFADLLLEIAPKLEANILVLHSGHIWVLCDGKVSATKRHDLTDETVWANQIAARAATFLSFSNTDAFESLTSAVFDVNHIE